MRIHPKSRAFTVLLGLLASIPTFGIDMVLPTLPAVGADLGVRPSEAGLLMSAYLLGLGVMLAVCGTVADRVGRKPVIVVGCVLMILASIGCLAAQSLNGLLIFRALQGAGAAGPGLGAFAMVRDLFDGAAARARMAYVVCAVNIVPMIAPTVGAALLPLGSWRAVHLAPIAGASVLLVAMRRMDETARLDPAARLTITAVVRDYRSVLAHPVCLGNLLCNGAAAGAVFAYITGSSLFFIDALGFSPGRYGFIFGASSVAVMAGTRLNQRWSRQGTPPGQLIRIGLALATVLAALLLAMALAGGRSTTLVVLVMVGVALAFGLISPNAIAVALQPLPAIAGSVSGVGAFIQMLAAGSSSALVAALFDGRSVMSMAAVMIVFCLLASCAYLGLARAAEPTSVPVT